MCNLARLSRSRFELLRARLSRKGWNCLRGYPRGGRLRRLALRRYEKKRGLVLQVAGVGFEPTVSSGFRRTGLPPFVYWAAGLPKVEE